MGAVFLEPDKVCVIKNCRSQRVLNDLQWTRLSCGHMICLLFLSLPVCRRSSLLPGEGGAEANDHKRA
jgi:hypothetical protein